ncbi:MAG: ABC transporter ATP-binding protein [Firmicutes bacterium]|nr:ABC transporter ATP-binding protein [Bacillota bacterium]
MSKVTLKNITKVYGTNTVVDHINLEVENGSLVSILGPSGCGKTTTLRMIAGFELPDDGEVLFDDKSVGNIPVNKRNIGMVFQSYALFPHMTVNQNVAYGLEQQKVPKDEIKKRVQDALTMVHMGDFGNRKPKQLSGGQQQRVALARALVIKPKVLLLDESLSALDKKLRVEMQTELRRILEETGVTTFFVTHDQEEAMTLSDRIVVMRDGIIEQTGSPREVYEKPVNRFVADFLGKANFFEGVVKEVKAGSVVLEDNDGRVFEIPAVSETAGSDGDSVQFAVRPEKIAVYKGEKPADKNSSVVITGKVDSVVYSGNITSCTVEADGRFIKAEMGGAAASVSIMRGDEVHVIWTPESTIRLEE